MEGDLKLINRLKKDNRNTPRGQRVIPRNKLRGALLAAAGAETVELKAVGLDSKAVP